MQRKVPPLSLRNCEPDILSIDDPRIPNQVAEEIRKLADVEEIAMFESIKKRETFDFRIKLKSGAGFFKYLYYTCD